MVSITYIDTASFDLFTGSSGSLREGDPANYQYRFANGSTGAGIYGDLSLNSNGSYSYRPNIDRMNAVPAGQTVRDSFSVRGSNFLDSNTKTVDVTIIGANDAPRVSGPATASAVEDGVVVTVSALAHVSDVDSVPVVSNIPSNLSAGISYDASSKIFTINPTNSSYQNLSSGETRNVSVAYEISDGANPEIATSVMFTVTGINDIPIVAVDQASIMHRTAYTGNLLSNDYDIDINDILQVGQVGHNTASVAITNTGVEIAGDYGSFTIKSDGSFTYDANKEGALAVGVTATDVFSYDVSDGHGGTATSAISFTVTGSGQGNAGDNIIIGRSANDVLSGLAGNDTLQGGDGNDILIGGTGSDVLDGGAGFDFVSYADATSGIVTRLDFGAGLAGEALGDSYTFSGGLLTVEGVIGSNFADTIIGDGAANGIYGGGGNDVILGLGGSDGIFGDLGNDTLFGGRGVDYLVGGNGAPVPAGQTDNDVFAFVSADTEAGVYDTIIDFHDYEDAILLQGYGYTSAAPPILIDVLYGPNVPATVISYGGGTAGVTIVGIISAQLQGAPASGGDWYLY